jgi:hypothetical protein
MAVEIREVIVRAILEDSSAQTGSQGAGPQGHAGDPCSQGSGNSPESIVRDAVDQVLRILERKKLR